jgi:hypothetical protein
LTKDAFIMSAERWQARAFLQALGWRAWTAAGQSHQGPTGRLKKSRDNPQGSFRQVATPAFALAVATAATIRCRMRPLMSLIG